MITIIRCEFDENSTFGVMLIDGRILCNTLELAWRNNERNISCIPTGVYNLYRREGAGRMEVVDVPNRSGILFHPANYHHELKGCIAVGTSVRMMSGMRAITSSRAAYIEFMHYMDMGCGNELQILEVRT